MSDEEQDTKERTHRYPKKRKPYAYPSPTRGGPRPNSGRKVTTGPRAVKNLRMTEETYALIEQYAVDNDMSKCDSVEAIVEAGIRALTQKAS